MNISASFSAGILASLVCSNISAFANDNRPNIILFMVDDMGWQDTSVPFWSQRTHYNDTYHTPNMQRLAAQGMMFTQAYASAISSPSRCSLLTGVNAPRHRVTNWTLKKNESTDTPHATLTPPDWNVNGISQVDGTDHTFVATSFVQILKDNGYHTIHCGKAHFGALDTPGENPCHFGFEVNISGHAAGGLASYLGEQNYGNTPDGKNQSLFAVPGLQKYWGTNTFVTEALTLEAIDALDKAKQYNQPFFLYMSHYAVHVPFDRDMRFYQSYIDKGLPDHEAAYASLIEGMDKSLGDIMDWLDSNNLSDNTIIIFMSDNGGYATSNAWRDGELYVQNYPLNSGKGSLYEGGVREPMIVSWHNVVAPNSRCNDIVQIEDFFPSILEMANISDYSTRQSLDGRSFVPELKGSHHNDVRTLYWNFPNNWGNDGPGINFNCAIRHGDWKLIYYYESGKKELFNITNDIGEKNDLAAKYPKITAQLSAQLGEYLRSCGAQRPIVTATSQPCPWPDE
jgi:arylsulfatase A-like enzyme